MANPFERAPGRKEGQSEMMTCPRCSGRGQVAGATCDRCRGTGRIPNRS
jgi:DnaJ-class molecular chaperone